MLRGTVSIALAASLLCLSGCAAEPAVTTPAPVPSTTTSAPVFASKEEALAAAEKVYRRYLEVSDEQARNPSTADVGNLDGLATSAQIAAEMRTYKTLEREGVRLKGMSSMRAASIQSLDRDTGAITVYVCVDYSNVTIEQSGSKPRRPSAIQQSKILYFLPRGNTLLFDGQEPYTGKSLC